MTQFLYKFAVILHLGFAFWMLSNDEIIQREDNFKGDELNDLKENELPFSNRLTSLHSTIIFVAFIVTVLFYIVYHFFSAFFCCNFFKIEKDKSKNLIEQLSYDDLSKEYFETTQELKFIQEENYELKIMLNSKLEIIGNALKSYFSLYGKDQVSKIPSNKLPKIVVSNLFYEHKEELIKSTIQGLFSYRMMV